MKQSPVAAAIAIALYGIPAGANAAASAAANADEQSVLTEVVVTANRRQQTTEEVPYSLSVVSPTQIANAGVTDLASLARQVPGVSMYDTGARTSGTVFPIIRGLNASPSSGGFRTFEQAPVGTYIGNSPIDGYFQLDDVQRVEVLRGPQGTLYGAGALGGALRIIPNAPELNGLSGNVELRGGSVVHADRPSYTASAMVNVPINDTLAFRASGNYEYEPGFIDVYGLMKLGADGVPARADPSDPVNSPAIFSGRKNWNDQKTFTGRGSVLWKPSERFNAQLAYMYSHLNGDGDRAANVDTPAAPFVGDPRINFPAGGDYQTFSAFDAPYRRKTDLTSLDVSFDAGFATLSSTSSYLTTDGSGQSDISYSLYRLPQYLGYYAGNPINPRFGFYQVFADNAHTFSQEVRLVSNTGPDKLFDYVVGLFYQNQTRKGSWVGGIPGSPERAAAQGCTGPYSLGADFPDCLPLTNPDDLSLSQRDAQHFQDKSIFGELTWHIMRKAQLTAGVRRFKQTFEDTQSLELYSFGLSTPETPIRSPASKTTWKVNPSLEYASNHHVYALWSQGFRRGGSNAIPLTGPFADNPALLTYQPDSVNNYEAGLKGHFANGLTYAFDVFDVRWNNPQVSGTTPTTNFAVWNADKAESKGVELDLNTPLVVPGLSIALSGAYADAHYTKDYLIHSTFGDIVGKDGEQLPGSPKVSAAATLNYQRMLAGSYHLTLSLNDTYRDRIILTTFAVLGNEPKTADSLNLINASATVSHAAWNWGVFTTNLGNTRKLLVPANPDPASNFLVARSIVNSPREIYFRVGYSF